jgi:hypothetical protein
VAATSPIELRVSVDVGARRHHVAIGLSSGEVLEEFAIAHQPEGFTHFFTRIETHHQQHPGPVAVAMEGYNGYARPLDQLIQAHGYQLYNIRMLMGTDMSIDLFSTAVRPWWSSSSASAALLTWAVCLAEDGSISFL